MLNSQRISSIFKILTFCKFSVNFKLFEVEDAEEFCDFGDFEEILNEI